MSKAAAILENANRLRSSRLSTAKVQADYADMNRRYRRQKAALTRAINSGDPERVVLTCWKTVREWNDKFVSWPDDWARWNVALGDAAHKMGFGLGVQLEDIEMVSEDDLRAELDSSVPPLSL